MLIYNYKKSVGAYARGVHIFSHGVFATLHSLLYMALLRAIEHVGV